METRYLPQETDLRLRFPKRVSLFPPHDDMFYAPKNGRHFLVLDERNVSYVPCETAPGRQVVALEFEEFKNMLTALCQYWLRLSKKPEIIHLFPTEQHFQDPRDSP